MIISRILITGGNRGIGEACVRRFFKNPDAKIVFTYRQHGEEAENLVKELQGEDRIRSLPMDLGQIDSIKQTTEEAKSIFGGFDIVVLNAGFCRDGNFFFMEDQDWQSVTSASLNSFFYITKACVGDMLGQRFGRIITLASVSGEAGNRGQVNYSAAKGAVISATKALAKEVARKGVTANVVSPGLIATAMTEELEGQEHFDVKQMIPVGRLGRPDEVAAAVEFLASKDASYINGTVLQVNGGLYT